MNLASNPGFLQILEQLRGEQVELDTAGGTVTGLLLGVESIAGGFQVNLLDARNRVANVSADSVVTYRAADPAVQQELRRALGLLSESRYSGTKRVSIRFLGVGSRRVLVGYVVPVPVWKTSYRLVLGDSDHLLQGWAIVENMTREDWEGVTLRLVSGRPVSFVMDLYRPIMIGRPSINLDVTESIAPPSYADAEPVSNELFMSQIPSAAPRASQGGGFSTGSFGRPEEREVDLTTGVASAASGARAGEFFQYAIDEPVSLGRSESAMVPIVSERVEGERLSIFNQATHAIHPFNSLRLHNSTSLDLAGGPITLFEAGSYAGDARINLMSPEDAALLSYSLDLATSLKSRRESKSDELTEVSIENGVLRTYTLSSFTTFYEISWTHSDGRSLIVEHAFAQGWNLIAPAALSDGEIRQTANHYRFEFDPASVPRLDVTEIRTIERNTSLAGAGDETIGLYLDNDDVPQGVKQALLGIIVRRSAIQETVRMRRELEGDRGDIYRDQARIRENLDKISEGSDLYERYFSELDEQEDDHSRLGAEITALEREERRQRLDLEQYIENLSAG